MPEIYDLTQIKAVLENIDSLSAVEVRSTRVEKRSIKINIPLLRKGT